MSKIGNWFAAWKLLSWRTAIVVAVALYALVGFFGVPWIAEKVVLKKVSERLGHEITVEQIRCNPFALSLTVDGLSLPDRSGSTMLSFDQFYANLQASSLFRWAVTLRELRVDNPYVALRRLEDKEINILEVLAALESGEAPEEKREGFPRAILHKIRVNDGRLEVEDQARDEPMVWSWGPAQLDLDDISTLPEKEGGNDFIIAMPNGGTIRVNGQVVMEPFGLDGSLSFDKMHLAEVWRAVGEKFEFDLTEGELAGDLTYRVQLEDDGLHFRVENADFTLSDLELRTEETETKLVEANLVTVVGVEALWPEQRVEAVSLIIDGAYAFGWIEPDGTASWETLVPEPTREEVVKAYEYIGERVDIDARLGRFEIKNASASFEDRTFDEPHRLEVTGAGLMLTDVASKPGSQWGLEAAATLGTQGLASAKGSFGAVPLKLDAEVGLESLDLAQFQAYIARQAPLDLRAGLLDVAGQIHLAPSEERADLTFAGNMAVTGLDLDETVTGGTLLGWGDLKVEGIEAALAPMSLAVEQVDIYRAGLEIAVAEDGTINLLEFFKAMGEGEGSSTKGEAATDAELPPARIASLELHDCYGRYTDATTVEAFERKLDAVNGTITGIATDTDGGAEIKINAAVDSGGAVRVTGEIDPFDYARLTDLDIDIREVTLPPLSPMSVKAVGHPIDSGRATLDLSVNIDDSEMKLTNHVVVANLEFGDKVEGEGAINLPVKLGVSLLKDKEGRITLDIPVEGNLDDPDFVMVSAVKSAATEIMGEIAKSPFRLLGRLGGGSDDQDLEFVDFEAGSTALQSYVITNMETLAKALQQRPSLSLQIEGSVDLRADALALNAVDSDTLPEGTDPTFEPLAEDQIQELATTRSEVIRAYLVDELGVESSRVTVSPETATVETSEQWVKCHLSITNVS